jgi:hypothetical protein
VTPETFAAWQEQKRIKRQEESKKRVESELRKKKGGKGLSVLTGRDLYEYKAELFKDIDDDAFILNEEDAELDGDQQANVNGLSHPTSEVDAVSSSIQTNLFLECDDDDLELDDDEADEAE